MVRTFSNFKKAQSSLEMAMVLIATTLLVTAVIKSWSWFGENMSKRTNNYNNSRLSAGSSEPGKGADYSQSKLTFFP